MSAVGSPPRYPEITTVRSSTGNHSSTGVPARASRSSTMSAARVSSGPQTVSAARLQPTRGRISLSRNLPLTTCTA